MISDAISPTIGSIILSSLLRHESDLGKCQCSVTIVEINYLFLCEDCPCPPPPHWIIHSPLVASPPERSIMSPLVAFPLTWSTLSPLMASFPEWSTHSPWAFAFLWTKFNVETISASVSLNDNIQLFFLFENTVPRDHYSLLNSPILNPEDISVTLHDPAVFLENYPMLLFLKQKNIFCITFVSMPMLICVVTIQLSLKSTLSPF